MAKEIVIKTKGGKETYYLNGFERSNAGTCYHQTPIVRCGDKVSKGQVIGVNTLKLSGTGIEGIGFAIPINSTIDVYKELINNGKISRPYIGITGIDLDETTAKKNNLVEGIYVKSVEN